MSRLLTCLARYRLSGESHRCALELPHMTHRCPCGVIWI